MNTLRKTGAVLISVSLAAGILAGCGSGSSAETTSVSTTTAAASSAAGTTTVASSGSGSVALTFSWWGNQTRNDRTQKAIELYCQNNTDVTIDGQFSQWADYWQKLATASAGEQLPDVLQMDYQYIAQYGSSDQLLDLTPYVESGVLDTSNWDENMISAGTVDGKFIAVTAGINVPAMVYNKTVTDQAGVTIKDNMTLDEFIEVCRTIYENTGYKTSMKYGATQELFSYWVRSDDNVLLDEEQIQATQEQMEKYFGVYEQGIEEGWELDPSVFAEISIGSVEQDPLIGGTTPETSSWVMFCWSNQYTALTQQADGRELEMTTWPSPDPQKSDYLKPSQFFSVSQTSANPDEAVEFINWLINSSEANNILLGERGVPVNSEIAAEVKAQLSETDQKTYDFLYDVVMPESSPIDPPYPSGYAEVGTTLNNLVEQICYQQIDSAEAAEQFIAQGNSILQAKSSE